MNSFEEKHNNTPHQNLFTPYYKSFIEQKDACMSLWLVNKNYQTLLHEFIETENQGNGVFKDKFIQLKSAFKNRNDYTQELINELNSASSVNKSQFNMQVDASALLQNLANIQNETLTENQNLILWLKPALVSDNSEIEQWLDELLNNPFPKNVKISYDKEPDGNYFEDILTKHGPKILLLQPDDNDAYSDLVENENDPSVQFRSHFIKFGEAISSGEKDQALKHGELAKNIAQNQENWEQLEVGILIAMAEVLIEDETQHEKALKYLSQAESSAKAACEKENPAGNVLLVQTLNSIGSAHIYLGNFNIAIKQFEAAIAHAAKDDYCSYYLMEAQRLIALCYEQNGDLTSAWDLNNSALITAEKLDPQIRSFTTLPNIGEALIRLSSALNRNQEINRIHQKMVEFVGENWEEML
jgi:hypothetical protein